MELNKNSIWKQLMKAYISDGIFALQKAANEYSKNITDFIETQNRIITLQTNPQRDRKISEFCNELSENMKDKLNILMESEERYRTVTNEMFYQIAVLNGIQFLLEFIPLIVERMERIQRQDKTNQSQAKNIGIKNGVKPEDLTEDLINYIYDDPFQIQGFHEYGKRYQTQLNQYQKLSGEFEKNMTEEQRGAYQEMQDAYSDLHAVEDFETFSRAFRLGIKFAVGLMD